MRTGVNTGEFVVGRARVAMSSAEQAFDIEQARVSVVRGEVVERSEIFEIGDPAAQARFEELSAPAAPVADAVD
jgi:hypothetical protein